MNQQNTTITADLTPPKFSDPDLTADGSPRARVALVRPQTLWFNTGTLCNIACENCYIESTPTNDRLVYLTAGDVADYLDQIEARAWPVREIGFTGGEPFMNPAMPALAEQALARGHEVLILTNAMRPMMRPNTREKLGKLIAKWRDSLTFRVSIDHPDPDRNDRIRGKGSHAATLEGMCWLRDQGATIHVAGRMLWGENEADARAGYARFLAAHALPVDAHDPAQMVLFPEMDDTADVPEITAACWGILDKSPADVMCASSRMVVRRRGAAACSVVACTLLPYDTAFDLGETLADAERDVALNHPHCAKFCVLGGASCSG